MKLKFIKLDIEIMNDSKIKFIRKMPEGDSLVMMWIGLICIAMKSGIPGTLQIGNNIPFTDELLASELNLQLNTVRLGLKTFQNLKMIELFPDNTYYLTNFEKHQEIDKIERNNELNRQRVKKCREKKKMLLYPQNVMITESLRNDNDTPAETETKTETETEDSIKLSVEVKQLNYELHLYGWNNDFKKLLSDVGAKACCWYWKFILKKKIKNSNAVNIGGLIHYELMKNAKSLFEQFCNEQKNKKLFKHKQNDAERLNFLKKQYSLEVEKHLDNLVESVRVSDIQEFLEYNADNMEFVVDAKGNPTKIALTYFLSLKYPYKKFDDWCRDNKKNMNQLIPQKNNNLGDSK